MPSGAALAANRVQVVLVFTTNRLFRKNYKALKFIEEEIVERGLRCLFVKNKLDTADGDRWRLPLQLHAAIDEAGTGMYAENVRAGHLGLFLRARSTARSAWATGGNRYPESLPSAHARGV